MATIGLAGAVALASSIALGGCFGIFVPASQNACERATNHLTDCLGSSVVGDTGGSTQTACDGNALCSANCINVADCEQIKDAFSGMPTSTSQPFIDCISACRAVPPSSGASGPGL